MPAFLLSHAISLLTQFRDGKPFHTFPGIALLPGRGRAAIGPRKPRLLSLFWRQLLRRDIVIAGVGPTIHFGSPAWIVGQARDEGWR
jgi:hypothetical protein